MEILANFSIRRKLTLIIMLTSAAALFLAGVAFLAYELITFRSAMVQNVSTLAEVIGTNSTAALVFSDPKTAEETLAALAVEPHIVAAQIYKKDSTAVFASYVRPGTNPLVAYPMITDNHIFQGDYLVLRRPIILNKERLGDIFLQSDLLAMSARLKRYAVIVVLVLALSMTIAYFLAAVLQQVISKPIFHLVQTARIVSQRKDYSVRASKLGRDELGTLVDSFNEMLTQIHRQDEVLRETNKALVKVSRDNQLVLDSAGEGICGLDLQGRATFVNPAAGKILNAAPEELTGKPLHEWLQHDNGVEPSASPGARKNHPFYDVLRDGKVHHSDGEIFQRRDGTTFPLDFTCNPIRDETNALVGAVVTFKDITERKHAEEQIRESLHEKEVLLKEIHHRVKNNLQVITSLLNLQSGAITQPEVLAMFMESQNRIRSMALIHEKLYQSPDLAKIDFADYADNLARHLYRTYVVNTGLIKLTVDMENIYLDVDSALPCGLIINELVSNSLKYAFPNERKGEVAIRLSRQEDGKLALRVQDNGVGLPAGMSVSNSKSLGLKLVHILTKQLAGQLEYKLNPGTEFKIVFRTKEKK